jgi:hypothetical protein
MQTVSTATHAEYVRLAGQLAVMPDVIARLLVDHTADSAGRCRGCTRGGTGYPAAAHPCSLHRLALMALDVRRRTGMSVSRVRPST